jgi:extracellular factor (EF) 3-hydroxypalmitic acid methyl ester biosynthesis protein
MTTFVRHPAATDLFDLTHQALLGCDVHAGMTLLRTTLRELRDELPREHWTHLGERARQHPVHQLLLESPFTRRAFSKPRGYAGDAEMMDLIYGIGSAALSPLGAMLYAYEFDSPCFTSVRRRRAILAREIDMAAARRPGARVLAVACGHLREIEWSRAATARDVSITAVDQDSHSLDFIGERYAHIDVTPVALAVRDLLRQPRWLSGFDLAYAAGLYDYLDDDVASALTAALFRMLEPGGRLLLANFTPAAKDAAFMEAIMDWHLIYRSPEALLNLTHAIDPEASASVDQFCDDNGHICYLRVVKR